MRPVLAMRPVDILLDINSPSLSVILLECYPDHGSCLAVLPEIYKAFHEIFYTPPFEVCLWISKPLKRRTEP